MWPPLETIITTGEVYFYPRLDQVIFYFRIYFDSAIIPGLAILLRGRVKPGKPGVLAGCLLSFVLVKPSSLRAYLSRD